MKEKHGEQKIKALRIKPVERKGSKVKTRCRL
jgi:hypothetical protein